MEYINKIKSFLGLTNKQETDFEQYKVGLQINKKQTLSNTK